MLKELIEKNRSYRRFDNSKKIPLQTLEEMIDMARLSASGANLQPLKYIISNDDETNDKIFPHLAWAGYLINWMGPEEKERPSAYIIILGDTEISKNFGCDHGIAAQSITLAATEKGYGGCLIASIKRDLLKQALGITDKYEILLVVALGVPVENIVIDKIDQEHGVRYWRDQKATHHVPKRKLEEIIIKPGELWKE